MLMNGLRMRKLVYYVATTLDGFIASPDGGDPSGSEFFPITDDLIKFIVTNYPETLPAPAREAMGLSAPGEHFDTVLEGRSSYELGVAAGLSDAYPHLRHLVFSTTLTSVGPGVELVSERGLERVRELKSEDGKDLWLAGGGTLAHSLLPEIDRLVLKVNRSIIGSGIPLFNGPFAFHDYQPTSEVLLDSGVRVLVYDRVSS